MSVSSQISRIQGLRDRIRNKLIGLGLLSSQVRPQSLYLEDCTDAIEGITGTQNITSLSLYDVAGKQYAQVNDANLIAQNIAKGVTILGVTGTHSGSTPTQLTQSKDMYLGGAAAPAIVYPDSGYLLTSVSPAMIANPVLIPQNIKNGVTIMGVQGSFGASDIAKLSRTYTSTGSAVSSVSFDISSDIGDIGQIVLCRVRMNQSPISPTSSPTLLMFEMMPNAASPLHSYSCGFNIYDGDVGYFNVGVSVTFNAQGVLTFTSNDGANFIGDYILECYYFA